MYPRLQAVLDDMDLDPIQVSAGHKIALDEDLTLEVLHPPPVALSAAIGDRNNSGLVLRLVYGETRLILTADIEAEAERHLLRTAQTIQSDVLKLAHHGSKTSSTAEFLERVSPSVAVASAGFENQYGHPHPEVMARVLRTVGPGATYQTSQNWYIELISDGREW